MLDSLKEIYSANDNYKNYRNFLKKNTTTCTPYIGLFLRDLVFIDDGNQNFLGEGIINFKKRALYSRVLIEIKRLQSRSYTNFALDEEILPFIVHYEILSDVDAYQQSQRIEPKDPYVVIEELLTEEEKLRNKVAELQKKLSTAKARHSQLQKQNVILQSKRNTTDSWQRFSPHNTRKARTNLLLRTPRKSGGTN